MPHDAAVNIVRVTPRVFRASIGVPIQTSFGFMRDRPMLLVEVEDASGAVGWGEVWCNFPSVGAEHRARLIDETISSTLMRGRYETPQDAFSKTEQALATLAIQAGEPGPLAQCLAGIDIAVWDMVARRNNVPIATLLGSPQVHSVPAYASGINPKGASDTVARARQNGFTAFKLKVGFGQETDLANLDAIRRDMADAEILMVDANQGWSLEQALSMTGELQRYGLEWLEEPLRADAPLAAWQTLAGETDLALAAGENIRGDVDFEAVLSFDYLRVVQPDLAKWGGFSRCAPLAENIIAAGRRFCPHWLGGGIGLVASAHLLAHAGGDGTLEVDFNDNPLRSALLPEDALQEGRFIIPTGPGLGVEPELAALSPFAVGY
ncbi:mandelate racemase/muconate lactonizing enzyme family protein [Devosia sp. A449]